MGEIAEAMLDGTLCQVCGEYVGGTGYPTTCAACRREESRKKNKRERWEEVAKMCPHRRAESCYSSRGKPMCGSCKHGAVEQPTEQGEKPNATRT